MRRRWTTSGRTSCRPATSRRIRCRARSGTIPTRSARRIRRSPTTARRSRSSTRAWTTTSTGGGTVTFSGGVAGTEGIIHTGIGPFDIDSDSRLTYFTARYQKGGRRVAFFTNLLDGDAANLLAAAPTGQPLPLDFDTKTFDVEAGDVRAIGTRARADASAATSATTRSTSRSRPTATTATRAAPTSRTRSSSATTSAGWSAAASTSSRRSTTRCSRRGRRFMVKPDADADVPRLVQPRVPRAVVHQQPHRHDDPQRR